MLGVLARFETKQENDETIEHFFSEGLSIVQQQAGTTAWFAFRITPTTFAAFAAFPTEEDRQTQLSIGGPKVAANNANLFVQPPTFDRVDIVTAKLDAPSMVRVGSLVRFETKPGKEADFERFLKDTLDEVKQASGTKVWFAYRVSDLIFGIFDAFEDDEGREAHLLAGAQRAERAAALIYPPSFDKVDIIAAKLPIIMTP